MQATVEDAEMVQAWRLLQRLHDILHRRLEGRMAEHDLTQSQAAILTLLIEAKEALPLSRVARLLDQEPQRMTWAMDRLESRHLVRREPHPTDRRVIHTHLTPAGALLGRQAQQARLEGLAQVLGLLEPRSFRCFSNALARLTADTPSP